MFEQKELEPLETIAAQTGVGFELRKGDSLFIIDPCGQQVCDFFCFAKTETNESFSSGRTIDYADSIYISTGAILYSNRSGELAKILDDTCGSHDLLMTPCSLEMFQLAGKNSFHHPSCLENLGSAFRAFGISEDRIGTTFNIFMNVTVDPTGSITIGDPKSKAGDRIHLLALTDLIVGLTACSHEGSNAGVCKPIQYRIVKAKPTSKKNGDEGPEITSRTET